MPEGPVVPMRVIETHHDGHGLTEISSIYAGEAGPGGAPDLYRIVVEDAGVKRVIEVQFQAGPRMEPGSKVGILESALLAIMADRMEGFNKGPYSCRENAIVLTKIQEAMHWLKHRADARAKRGVLGTAQK